MAKPIVIVQSCIGPKGAHLERGLVKEFSDEVTYNLVVTGRAVTAESEEGKRVLEQVREDAEKQISTSKQSSPKK